MTFENASWSDAGKTIILATVDGVQMCIPVDPQNRHYAALMASGVEIADAG